MNYIIVTNTYKRSAHLVEKSLRASLNQKIKPQRIILINQNSGNFEFDSDIISNPLIAIEKTKHKSVSAARNTLQIPANTDWIFFCDDDGYACESYSEILEQKIKENPGIEILAGSIIRDDTKEYYTLRHKKGGSLKHFRYTKNLMGSNFVIKADVFDRLGRFDEQFGAGAYWGSSEETDFCWKAYFNNVNMDYFSELKVYHVPPFNESVKKGFKKSFQYATGKGALVYKWLIKKKRLKVLYEFFEMFLIPPIQIVRGLITLKPQLSANNFAVLAGRIFGFLKAIFVMRG